MKHTELHATIPRWQGLTAALTLSALTLALAAPAMSQEGQQAQQQEGRQAQQQGQGMADPYYDQRGAPPVSPRTSIYGEHSRYYGGPNYDILRPGGPSYGDPRMGRMMMHQWPQTGIYGRHSGMYGGPNYDILRPRGPWYDQPPMDWQMPPGPRTGIYGRDSRMYGGPNYNLLR